MELILLLILGGIVLLKLSGEKSTHRANERQRERDAKEQSASLENWVGRVTNKELETELEYKLYHNDKDLWAEADSSVEYYFGAKPEQSDLINEYYAKILTLFDGDDNQRIALRLLMANRGYLRYSDAECGIRYDTTAKIQRLADEKESMLINFFGAVDNKLVGRGIREQRYLYSRLNGKYYIFKGAESTTPICGYMYWAPSVSPFYKRLASRMD